MAETPLTIVACFSGKRFDDPPFDEPNWPIAYADLGSSLALSGATLGLVRHAVSYKGDRQFSTGWLWNDGAFQPTNTPLHASLIINKSREFQPTGTYTMINQQELAQACTNKMQTAHLFPHLSPRTVLLKTKEDVYKAQEISSDRIVLKPVNGSGGAGIHIVNRQDLEKATLSYPCIAQEFLDTSTGIPGIVDTLHDFRMIIADGDILLTFTRSPTSGNLLSNTSKGGYMVVVPSELRPEGALNLIPVIEARFARFTPRLYSIDCARTPDGTWKLIELNDQPGVMTRVECGTEADAYFTKLTQFLIRSAR